ncbi:MAG TPA: hypothetical protein VMU87_22785 [Stellaceae bacterium]|nr:hypothetical protein [Stellaceae bacterium]
MSHRSSLVGALLRRARLHRFLGFAVIPAAALLAASVGLARPPANADPALAPWYQSLRQPGTQVSCCSLADCRPTDYRTGANGYEAYIEGSWVAVPPDKVLRRVDNPTGRAVVCYLPGWGILCFVTPDEA